MLQVYGLKSCSTVKAGVKWLEDQGVEVGEVIDYRQTPPSRDLIERALTAYGDNPRAIMNTSGQLYRELGLKDRLAVMSRDEVLDLLSQEGMLIKRPFITDGDRVTVGRKEDDLATWVD